MPEAVTRNIRVHVESEFAPGRSNPQQNQWFFLYTIRITNEGRETVQLLSRHWIITDAMGEVREVRGPGVVGKQPRARAGRELRIHVGLRPDHAVRLDARNLSDGDRAREERFDIEIPTFTLTRTVHDGALRVASIHVALRVLSSRRTHRRSAGTRPPARRRCRAAS